MVAYRRDSNICDSLVHRKTRKATMTQPTKCECQVCQLIHTGKVYNTACSSMYETVSTVNCKDRNLVYGLVCQRCNVTVYVGETGRTLKERMVEHLRDIRMQADKPILRHFNRHDVSDVRVVVLQKVQDGGRTYRQLIEDIWIRKLGTVVPHGCNVKHA